MKINVMFVVKFWGIILLTFIFVAGSFSIASARKNPAACYCEAMGYEYTIEITAQGERGYCTLPDNRKVDAWEFVLGKVGQEYSYCEQNGYEMKTVDDWETCSSYGIPPCAVCILDDGSEVEITELMNLDLIAGECGDGICAYSETYENCPQDCAQEGDIGDAILSDTEVSDDESDGLPGWIIGIIIAAVIAAGVILYFSTRRRKQQTDSEAHNESNMEA